MNALESGSPRVDPVGPSALIAFERQAGKAFNDLSPVRGFLGRRRSWRALQPAARVSIHPIVALQW